MDSGHRTWRTNNRRSGTDWRRRLSGADCKKMAGLEIGLNEVAFGAQNAGTSQEVQTHWNTQARSKRIRASDRDWIRRDGESAPAVVALQFEKEDHQHDEHQRKIGLHANDGKLPNKTATRSHDR